jgi:hypothetical protein
MKAQLQNAARVEVETHPLGVLFAPAFPPRDGEAIALQYRRRAKARILQA